MVCTALPVTRSSKPFKCCGGRPSEHHLKLRSGDFRVLYRVDGALVTVMRVIDRKDLELVLRRLRLLQP